MTNHPNLRPPRPHLPPGLCVAAQNVALGLLANWLAAHLWR